MLEAFLKEMPKDGKTYQIVGKASGKAIAVDDGGRSARTRLVLAETGGAACLRFRLTAKGDDKWELAPACLQNCAADVYNGSPSDGAIVWAYPKNDSRAQRFRLARNPDGSFKILTETGGFEKAVVVEGDSSAVGAGIVQGAPNAQSSDWKFIEKE